MVGMLRPGTPHDGRRGAPAYVPFFTFWSHSAGPRSMCKHPLFEESDGETLEPERPLRPSATPLPASPAKNLSPIDQAVVQGHTAGQHRARLVSGRQPCHHHPEGRGCPSPQGDKFLY